MLLPVGISFYTFVAMGYVIDVYRRHTEPCRDLGGRGRLHRVLPDAAGRAHRARLLAAEADRSPRSPSAAQAAEGAWLILWGCFKKMFVADNLARVVSQVVRRGHRPGGLRRRAGHRRLRLPDLRRFPRATRTSRAARRSCSASIWSSTSGFPYLVRTPQEFWTHWHISLSEWLRDYLFLPLSFCVSRDASTACGGSGLRDDFWIYAAATLVTMLLGRAVARRGVDVRPVGRLPGGAARRSLGSSRCGRGRSAGRLSAAGRSSGGTRRPCWSMFAPTCYGWLVFRADSLAQAVHAHRPRLHRVRSRRGPCFRPSACRCCLHAGPLLAIHTAEASRGSLDTVSAVAPRRALLGPRRDRVRHRALRGLRRAATSSTSSSDAAAVLGRPRPAGGALQVGASF
ncbi:MAG: hypothetical protein MZU84_03920 [Sphingobacterium sp.]|nr:hypothetical protein [Sphingobacterium sp.]